MMPVGITPGNSEPKIGHFIPGHARFILIRTMKAPPHSAMNMESTRYCRPTTLWSVLKRYRRAKPGSAMGLLRRPAGELVRALDNQHALHLVVPEAAELRARKFEASLPGGGEPEFNRHPRHGVLFHPQVGEKETVDHVLGTQAYAHRPSDDRVDHVQRDDIVGPAG